MIFFYILRSKLLFLCEFKGDRSGIEEIRWEVVIVVVLMRDDLVKMLVELVNSEGNGWIRDLF